jgi:hypothetical protein
MPVPAANFDSAERVEILTAGSDRYATLTLASLSEMPGMADDSLGAVEREATAVAFGGGKMYFDGTPQGARVRLWYKPVYGEVETEGELADAVKGVPQSFEGLWVLRAAKMCRELIGLSALSGMDQEIVRLERQFRKWRTEGPESGLVKKQRGGRLGGKSPVTSWNGHRLFR